ncbi:MAG: hypothetical protein WC498_03145 [Candidatus Saccharimonadales bacterium]
MAKNLSTKRALIDKANSRVVIVTSVAAFVLIFSLVAIKALVGQAAYQNRILTAKHAAVKQLRADITASATLKSSYQAFTTTAQNVLSGNTDGIGAQDGNNAQIILDALPSNYDFPALATTLEKLLTSQNLLIGSITGTDDEVNQVNNQASSVPVPVAMPFQIAVTGDYGSIQNLIGAFEHSIRPFQVQALTIAGDQSKLTLNLTAQTFFQPAKSLNITTKVVK